MCIFLAEKNNEKYSLLNNREDFKTHTYTTTSSSQDFNPTAVSWGASWHSKRRQMAVTNRHGQVNTVAKYTS